LLYSNKSKVPPFLEKNPDIATIKQYYNLHLRELSVAFLLDYLHKTVFPTMTMEMYGKGIDDMGEEKYGEGLWQGLKPY